MIRFENKETDLFNNNIIMSQKSYFHPDDLKKFGEITEFQEAMGRKFFDYYNEVFKEGALTAREKSLIALAVAHRPMSLLHRRIHFHLPGKRC